MAKSFVPLFVLFCIVVLSYSSTSLAQDCTPIPIPITTSCVSADLSVELPECARLASTSLAAVPPGLPYQCSDSLKETICKSILSECIEVEPFPGFTVALPRAPCKQICTQATTACSQLFSFAGQLPPDCNQLNPVSCEPVFVETATTYPALGGLSIPCQPTSQYFPSQPFYCEKFKGKPEACTNYIGKDESISFNFALDQASAVAQAEAALTQFAALPDSCRFQAEEFVCRNFFRKCVTFSPGYKGVLPTEYYWGKAICNSGCDAFNVQCGELFGLQGAPLTNCEELSPALQNNPSYPEAFQVFQYPGGLAPMQVPCRDSDLKNQPQTFRCEKWTGSPSQCKPYLTDNDGNKEDIFILDAFDMETRVNLTTTFVAILKDLPKECREYATEMICRTIFQECKTFEDADLPTTYYIGKPPCKSICKNVRGCEKELKKVGIPIPDCGEDDTLTQGEVYPKRQTTLKVPNHSYSVSCIDSIHNPGNKRRRFAREVSFDETLETEIEVSSEDQEMEEEVNDYDPETSNTFNIAMSIAHALSRVSGVDHQASVISGLQADGAFENLIRSVSEKVARRAFA